MRDLQYRIKHNGMDKLRIVPGEDLKVKVKYGFIPKEQLDYILARITEEDYIIVRNEDLSIWLCDIDDEDVHARFDYVDEKQYEFYYDLAFGRYLDEKREGYGR